MHTNCTIVRVLLLAVGSIALRFQLQWMGLSFRSMDRIVRFTELIAKLAADNHCLLQTCNSGSSFASRILFAPFSFLINKRSTTRGKLHLHFRILQVFFFIPLFIDAMLAHFALVLNISSALCLPRIKCLQHEIDIQLGKWISVLFAVPPSYENILYKSLQGANTFVYSSAIITISTYTPN